jgi:hypothetical protein
VRFGRIVGTRLCDDMYHMITMAIAESVAVKVGDTVMTDFVGFQAARQKFRPRCTGCQNQGFAAAIL